MIAAVVRCRRQVVEVEACRPLGTNRVELGRGLRFRGLADSPPGTPNLLPSFAPWRLCGSTPALSALNLRPSAQPAAEHALA